MHTFIICAKKKKKLRSLLLNKGTENGISLVPTVSLCSYF